MLIGTPVTPSNHWRRRYTRPETVHSIGLEAAAALSAADKARGKKGERRRERQRALLRSTGFAGGNAELGHLVTYELRNAGYSERVARFGGHLCAVSGSFNFQGNYRLAKLVGCSVRTIQRARALLERDGLLSSYLLHPGDMVDGQNSPVTRYQIVRDVSVMQQLPKERTEARNQPPPHKRSRGRTERETPAPTEAKSASADEIEQAAAVAPDWLAPIIGAAAAGKRAVEAGGPRSARAEIQDGWVPDLSSHRGRMSAAELDQHLARTAQRRPVTEQQPTPPPSDRELDELDAELQRASEPRPADKPPPT